MWKSKSLFGFDAARCGSQLRGTTLGLSPDPDRSDRTGGSTCGHAADACCVGDELPLGRSVGVQDPCALHPGADRGHAGGERLLLHGQGPPGEAVLDGEHQSVLLGAWSSAGTRKKKKSNPPRVRRSKSPRTTWIKVERSKEEAGGGRRRRRREAPASFPPKWRLLIQSRARVPSGLRRATLDPSPGPAA